VVHAPLDHGSFAFVSAILLDASPLAEVPEEEPTVRPSTQAEKITFVLAEDHGANSVGVASDFQPNIGFRPLPEVMQDKAIVRIPSYDTLA